MRDDLKIGVFLCECGGNISDTIDLDEVKAALDVEFIGQFENLCSLIFAISIKYGFNGLI